jgi:PAS domain S-box-containing protein
VHSSIAPILNPAGQIAGYISIRSDITKRKLLEIELRNGQKFQELVMETAPVGIFKTDSEGACNYVNTTWCQITGLTIDHSMNDGWIYAIHPDDKYTVFGAWGDFVTGQSEFDMKWRFLRPDGSIKWVQGKASPVRNEAGKLMSYLGACVDVTELIATSQKLEAKQQEILNINMQLESKAQELEKASHAKSMFLANMSHEIRTPLNGVLGMSQVLAQSNLPEKSAEIVHDIIDSGEMLRGIINDLLDFSKIEAGSMSLESRAFNPRKSIEKTIALISKQAREKNITVNIHFGNDVPEYLIGDELRFRQILLNLTSNAVKFTKVGSVTIQADWAPNVDHSGELSVQVIDTGIGMSEDQVKKLFNPFSQADETITRNFGGTGLGLTISKRLAELMSGAITVSSTLGKGSTFNFKIRCSVGQAPLIAEITSSADESEVSTPSKLLHVLVAEDNATNQKLMRLIFQKLGIPVTIAANGLEAIKLSEERRWDIVFMDLQMPEMGGIEATRIIKSGSGLSKDTPIFALTANAFDEDKSACFEAGMQGFLSKPLKISDLQTILQSLSEEASHPAKKVG